MTTINTDSSDAINGHPAVLEDGDNSEIGLAVTSGALSGLGFLTLLSLADRRDRTPARELGLLFCDVVLNDDIVLNDQWNV